jgi:capsular polysaccharide biosynthesis protein
MSQQALDLRKSMQIVRRHKALMAILVVLGVLGGAAYTVLKPPMVTSTALIALPTSASSQLATTTGGTVATGTTDPFTATQEVVAGSYRVLAYALPRVRPAMSLIELRRYVQIGSPSTDIISVTAEGKNAADAETTANAVADSYIRYVGSAGSAVGLIRAQLLAPANNATTPSKVERTSIYALLGALIGALIGVILALAIGRSDRRLRLRDEIANSIGIPVLASLPVAHPSAAASWTKLLEDYKPTAAQSWQLRTALQQLGIPRPGFGRPAYDDSGGSLYDDQASGYDDDSFSLAVVSLSSDSRALALGPQLAVFAASRGIPTSLVIAPQHDAGTTASLRIACSVPLPQASKQHGLLRVAAYDEGGVDVPPDTALVVVVAVVDSRAPEMPDMVRTNGTIIGVSAGSATAEQLARTAMAATADGREISGILVADPLDTDETTGRIPRLAQSPAHRLPNRLRGIRTEIRR